MRRELSPRLAVLAGYILIACAFTWPLPLHLSTHFSGDPTGDTGVYVWNQWVFRHELLLGRNPFATDRILSLAQRIDLSQHNYTAFLDLLAVPLISLFGVVAAFNVVLLTTSVMTATATYWLARRMTGATRLEAWIAGVAFAWSPVLVARGIAHFSLVAAAPLAAFLGCLHAAAKTRTLRDASLAGLCAAWAAFCDAYFGVYCVIIAALCVVYATLHVSRSRVRVRPPWLWMLDVVLICVAGLVVGVIAGRGGQFNLLGHRVIVLRLYTPVLVLTVLAAVRLMIVLRPRVMPVWQARPFPLRVIIAGAIAFAGPLSPVLYGLGQGIAEGRFVNPPVLWRSSPHGVDLLSFFTPNQVHPLARLLTPDPRLSDPAKYVEYTASFSLVALVVIAWAIWRAGYRPRTGWLLLTGGFAALALGPFIAIAGFNTYVPGPWSLLRYVPVVSIARMPTRFAVVAALGLAVLLAGALAALGERWPARRRFIGVSIGALLLFELLPAPIVLYSASISPIYDIIAADARPVRVLVLPVGVRDGVSSSGKFNAQSLVDQTRHGKRLIGGYLSRISTGRLDSMRAAYPTLDTLIRLSEGRAPTADDEALLVTRGRQFAARTSLGYVVIDTASLRPDSAALIERAMDLREIARDGALVLYVPAELDDKPER